MTEVVSRSSVRSRPEAPANLIAIGLDRCGHCKAGHCRSCKGAVRLPKSSAHPSGLLICYCVNCDKAVRCLDCGNQFPENVNAETWRCWDPLMCRDRIRLRQSSDRLWRMIQECKTASARRRKENRLRREVVRSEVGPEVEDRVAKRSPRPAEGFCECCGVRTKGGKFAPGHDARLKSRLKKAASAGNKAAHKELVERGWI